MANRPTVYSFDEEHQELVLKGPFGSLYHLSTRDEALPFPHGSVIQDVTEGRDGNARAVMLGMLKGQVWFQYTRDTTATSLPFEDVERNFVRVTSQRELEEGDVEMEGPLRNVSYRLDTKLLDDVFDVRTGRQYYLKLWQSTVAFVGTFLRVPWVRIIRGPQRSLRGMQVAVPLAGCFTADSLRTLFGLCDVPSSLDGPLTESPMTRMTPRSTAAAAAYRITVPKEKATCSAPFGATLEVDIRDATLSPFELRHGDRVLTLRGVAGGKLATVIGVHMGNLVVHTEGDMKVTVVRGCSNAVDLRTQFAKPKGATNNAGVSTPQAASKTSAAAKAQAAAEVVSGAASETSSRAAPNVPPIALKKALKVISKESPKAASPAAHSTFRCWTAFGRYEFNTSPSVLEKFGYFHGQSLRCCDGAEAGKLFHVVGERCGILWVVPDGRERAVSLAHCTCKSDIDAQYGFTVSGTKDLTALHEREDEPPSTPFNSPRSARGRSRTSQSPRNGAADGHAVADPPVVATRQLEAAFFEAREAPLELQRQLPLDVDEHRTLRSNPALSPPPALQAEAATLTSSRSLAPLSRNLSSNPNQPNDAPAVDNNTNTSSSSNDEGAKTTSSGKSARNYLKAVAMFMLGTTNQSKIPLPFHEYYAVDPTKRLGAALRKLDATREGWARVHPTKPFSEAAVEDILRLFAKHPELVP